MLKYVDMWSGLTIARISRGLGPKCLAVVCLWLAQIIPVSSYGQGHIMNPGDAYTITFTNLPFVRTAISGDASGLTMYFVNNGIIKGESMTIECFNDSTNGTPYFGATLSTLQTVERFTFGLRAWSLDWPDLRGTIVLTMLQGSVELQSVRVDHVDYGDPTTLPGLLYSQTFSVPEPTCLSILVVGSLFLVWHNPRKSVRWRPN